MFFVPGPFQKKKDLISYFSQVNKNRNDVALVAGAAWNIPALPRAIWGRRLEPPGGRLEPPGTAWGRLKPPGAAYGRPGPLGAACDRIESRLIASNRLESLRIASSGLKSP